MVRHRAPSAVGRIRPLESESGTLHHTGEIQARGILFMIDGHRSTIVWCSLVALLIGGCVGAPEVRSVYEDPRTSVRLQEDLESSPPHSHPVSLSPVQMARVLAGVRVVEERYAVHELVAGSAPALAAFSAEEIRVLAPALSRAFSMAKPNELVTFYRRVTNDAVGLAYTSGGLFLHGGHLYIVLANYRQPPSDVMRRGIPAYEMDPIDDPLLSLLRGKYAISFDPQVAEVHPVTGDWVWSYPDPGKVVIVDAVLATNAARETGSATRPPTKK